MREKPTIVCAHCGVSFVARWAKGNHIPRFCSIRCGLLANNRLPRPLVPNPDDPETLLIPLTRGKFAVIDRADAGMVGKQKWHDRTGTRSGTTYAMSGDGQHLHRLIAGAQPGELVDHIDHDGLNNRRSNLRRCDAVANMLNRRGAQSNSKSGIRGISFDESRNKWVVQLKLPNGQGIRKRFETLDQAVAAWEAHYAAYRSKQAT